ncbi:MAG TPA: LuxR C-terminal-related transcriptional regulator [Pseudonocardiaceae bacterium]|nr:LuxR C-terminal-related transcriptional regulator [Pseudonocardiaceae bacterium]
MTRTRVIVHAFSSLTTAGVLSLLSTRPEIEVVSGDSAQPPDAVVVVGERAMPNLVTRVRRILWGTSAPSVLVVDDLKTVEVVTAVEHRVRVIMPRAGLTADRLLSGVLTAAQGGGAMSPTLLGPLLDWMAQAGRDRPESADNQSGQITAREADVLRLAAEGLPTKEISENLGCSQRVVADVVHGLLTRLRLHNRTHAVAYALRAGAI